jgi:hypothetical protein
MSPHLRRSLQALRRCKGGMTGDRRSTGAGEDGTMLIDQTETQGLKQSLFKTSTSQTNHDMSKYYTDDEVTELIAALEAKFPGSLQEIIDVYSMPDGDYTGDELGHFPGNLNSATKDHPIVKKLSAELQAEILAAAGGEFKAGQEFEYRPRDGGRGYFRIDDFLIRLGWINDLGAQQAQHHLYSAIADRAHAILATKSNGSA